MDETYTKNGLIDEAKNRLTTVSGDGTVVIEGYGRVGSSGASAWLSTDSEDSIVDAVSRKLDMPVGKLHDVTCIVRRIRCHSITGDTYLADKVVKYRIEIKVDVELVSDREAIFFDPKHPDGE